MTSILNKLVSACETIEANGGSGGGGSGSDPAVLSSVLNKSSFSEGVAYVPISLTGGLNYDAKVFIKANGETFFRYYIELSLTRWDEQDIVALKVFKNSSDPDDGTELTFSLVKAYSWISSQNAYWLKISGLTTLIQESFTICTMGPKENVNQHEITSTLDGNSQVSYAEVIPMEAVSSRHQ